MGELPLPAIVGWLVHERYGGYDAETKILGQMSRVLPEFATSAAKYRAFLERSPDERVHQIFQGRLQKLLPEANAAILNRESLLFFHQPTAVANYGFWSRAAVWTLEEAVALSFGRDPEVVNWKAFEAAGATETPFAASYRRLAELVHRSILAGLLREPIQPAAYLVWCKQFTLPVPPPLVAAVEDLAGRLTDWKAAFEKVRDMYRETLQNAWDWYEAYLAEVEALAECRQEVARSDELAVQLLAEIELAREQLTANALPAEPPESEIGAPPLGTRERDSLLKMIAIMAVDGYGYVPSASKSPIPRQLADLLVSAGIPLSDDTVRKYLKAAADLLPADAELGVA